MWPLEDQNASKLRCFHGCAFPLWNYSTAAQLILKQSKTKEYLEEEPEWYYLEDGTLAWADYNNGLRWSILRKTICLINH